MSLILVLSLSAMIGFQDPSPAPDAQPSAAPAAADAPASGEADPLERVVCRTEAVVGTRFDSRVCMTRRQWNARRDESRRLAHRLESANANRNRQTAPGH
ncbi:hypothetical protein [Brevundimonas viscosa]|uniref:Uncharacterized protein n=1 Tax=Brevundimonas viscosa TaxID=871741 RepID=A0A1I6S331_9CAUL|nr:hypothetical protein [Brevundimonas viscosa]SFS71316.1 hypothetical protein SAMN05192570_2129 [Brevundimonas viscosa]